MTVKTVFQASKYLIFFHHAWPFFAHSSIQNKRHTKSSHIGLIVIGNLTGDKIGRVVFSLGCVVFELFAKKCKKSRNF